MALIVACEQFIDAEEELDCDCNEIDDELVEGWIDEASDIIAILTGGKIQGGCTDSVRPRRSDVQTCLCQEIWNCSCGPLTGVTLQGPRPTVTEVKIDGVVFTDWQVMDDTLLVRTDGQNWPGCQDLTKTADESGSFQVNYTFGDPVNPLVKKAANEIVCEVLRAGYKETERREGPSRARSMNVSGVQITLEQQVEEIRRRAFMLPSVIRLLTVYAPDGATPAVVYSPELEDGWQLHRVTQTPTP